MNLLPQFSPLLVLSLLVGASAIAVSARLLRADQYGQRSPLALIFYVTILETAMLYPLLPLAGDLLVGIAGTLLVVLSWWMLQSGARLPHYLIWRILSVPDQMILLLPLILTVLFSGIGLFVLVAIGEFSWIAGFFCVGLVVSVVLMAKLFIREKKRWADLINQTEGSHRTTSM